MALLQLQLSLTIDSYTHFKPSQQRKLNVLKQQSIKTISSEDSGNTGTEIKTEIISPLPRQWPSCTCPGTLFYSPVCSLLARTQANRSPSWWDWNFLTGVKAPWSSVIMTLQCSNIKEICTYYSRWILPCFYLPCFLTSFLSSPFLSFSLWHCSPQPLISSARWQLNFPCNLSQGS